MEVHLTSHDVMPSKIHIYGLQIGGKRERKRGGGGGGGGGGVVGEGRVGKGLGVKVKLILTH